MEELSKVSHGNLQSAPTAYLCSQDAAVDPTAENHGLAAHVLNPMFIMVH